MDVLIQVIDNLKDYIYDVYQGPTIDYMVFKNRDHFIDESNRQWASFECLDYICKSEIDCSTIESIKSGLQQRFVIFESMMLGCYKRTNKYMFYIAYTVAKDMQLVTMDFFKSYI